MNPKQISNRVLIAAALTLCARMAFADDNSMSVLTGDSYSYFNNLDYNPGHYNAERTSEDAPLASNTVGPVVQQSHEAPRQSTTLVGRARITLRVRSATAPQGNPREETRTGNERPRSRHLKPTRLMRQR